MIKKGGVSTYIECDNSFGFTNNLLAYNTQISIEKGIAIKFDLNPNINKRNKNTNTYIDAIELAEGSIKKLTLIQINDDTVLKTIKKILNRENSIPDIWELIIELKGEHIFKTIPEFTKNVDLSTFFLHIKK